MALFSFTDLLRKAGLDPAKVKLIRHSMNDKVFRECFLKNKVFEYTRHQNANFSKGYDYWAVFLSDTGTLATFFGLYHVASAVPDTAEWIARDISASEAEKYEGGNAFFQLEPVPLLSKYEGKLTIDWGKSARMWHQKGTSEKPIVALSPDERKVFSGYEDLILSFDELREIVENETAYEAWHTALSSVYAIYLIVDRETGRQYVGSAYGNEGLWGRWSDYVNTRHGGNKRIRELLELSPERYHSFQFSVLQILSKALTNDEVIAIEQRYKRKLLSVEFGMNEN